MTARHENTIRLFRERLTRSGVIARLFEEFDRQLKMSGYLAIGSQIVDASLVAAPRQRNTAVEKAQIKAGRKVREIWKDKPNKAVQKDTDAKISRPRDPSTERSVPELAIAVFGYKTHVAIDRFIGTVGIERAKVKIGLANIAYNMGRLIFHQRRQATG